MNELISKEQAEFEEEQRRIDLVLKAYSEEHSIGNLRPTKRAICKRTGLSPKQVKKIETSWNFNPKTSTLKFYIPTALRQLQEIINSEDTKDRTRIKAIEVYMNTFNLKEEFDIGGNKFDIRVMTAETQKITEAVEIRHAEIEGE
tara:strand:+ start:1130 stop:1564 length:435 start_codon:yes stop_codon:yes gene_type:complete